MPPCSAAESDGDELGGGALDTPTTPRASKGFKGPLSPGTRSTYAIDQQPTLASVCRGGHRHCNLWRGLDRQPYH